MSLINQMLKDLEQRNVPAEEIKPVSGEVRAAQATKTASIWPRLVLGVLLLGASLAAAWWNLKPASLPAAVSPVAIPAPSAVAPVVSPAVEQVPAGLPEPAPAPLAVPVDAPVTMTAPAPAVLVPPRLPGLSTELKIAPVSVPDAADQPLAAEKKTEAASASASIPAVTELAEEKPRKAKRAAKIGAASPAPSLKVVTPQQNSENLYKQSVTLLQQGRVAEAREALAQALKENPVNHNARQLLVGLLVESKRSGEALVVLQEGVRLAPEQSGFVMALARLQVESGDRKSAMQTLEQGAVSANEDAEYHGFYAALLQREGRHDEAAGAYLQALRGDPANTSWLVGVGISLQALGKYADAREAYERARQTGRLTPELTSFVDQRLTQIKGK